MTLARHSDSTLRISTGGVVSQSSNFSVASETSCDSLAVYRQALFSGKE